MKSPTSRIFLATLRLVRLAERFHFHGVPPGRGMFSSLECHFLERNSYILETIHENISTVKKIPSLNEIPFSWTENWGSNFYMLLVFSNLQEKIVQATIFRSNNSENKTRSFFSFYLIPTIIPDNVISFCPKIWSFNCTKTPSFTYFLIWRLRGGSVRIYICTFLSYSNL